jgi:hypothetical protein
MAKLSVSAPLSGQLPAISLDVSNNFTQLDDLTTVAIRSDSIFY